jgi:hypothetical protein
MLRVRLRWLIAAIAVLSLLLIGLVPIPALRAYATQGSGGEKD